MTISTTLVSTPDTANGADVDARSLTIKVFSSSSSPLVSVSCMQFRQHDLSRTELCNKLLYSAYGLVVFIVFVVFVGLHEIRVGKKNTHWHIQVERVGKSHLKKQNKNNTFINKLYKQTCVLQLIKSLLKTPGGR